MANEHFDVNLFTHHLTLCFHENLDLRLYIESYKEVNKLLGKLNPLFAFIVNDIDNKLKILSRLLNAKRDHYKTIKSMLNYEIEKDIIRGDKANSGVRTLLPLHRALNFVVKLIETVKMSNDNDNISALATTSYDCTLAMFHTWPVRQAVHAAFLTLPSSKTFLAKLVDLNVSKDEMEEVLNAAVIVGRNVFNGVEEIYAHQNLLNL